VLTNVLQSLAPIRRGVPTLVPARRYIGRHRCRLALRRHRRPTTRLPADLG
jgi:hypothetical protein